MEQKDRTDNSNAIQIGVILCNCGNTLAKDLNWNELEQYIRGLEDMKFVQTLHLACKNEDQQKIVSLLQEYQPHLLVFAGCSPRIIEENLKKLLAENGYDPNILTTCNIREHCIWSAQNRDDALNKSKIAISAAIARAKFKKKIESEESVIHKSIMVIGNGEIAKKTALFLLEKGFKIVIVDLTNNLSYDEGLKKENIEIIPYGKIYRIKGGVGNFAAKIKSEGKFLLRDIGAVVLTTEGHREVDSSILASIDGDNIFQLSNFIEILKDRSELDQLLKPTGSFPKQVIFLMGLSGEDEVHSSASVFKAALQVRELSNSDVWVIFRNAKVAGPGWERIYGKAREKGVITIKYEDKAPAIIKDEEGLKVVIEEHLFPFSAQPALIELPCDLLILDDVYRASRENRDLAEVLNLNLGPNNFFQEDNINLLPIYLNRKGIFVIGPARGATDPAEIEQDIRALSLEIEALLSSGKLTKLKNRVEVNKGKCTLCLTCVRHCPHGAIVWDRAAVILEEVCQACGICASECPAVAIQLKGFSNDEILAELKAM